MNVGLINSKTCEQNNQYCVLSIYNYLRMIKSWKSLPKTVVLADWILCKREKILTKFWSWKGMNFYCLMFIYTGMPNYIHTHTQMYTCYIHKRIQSYYPHISYTSSLTHKSHMHTCTSIYALHGRCMFSMY